MQARLVRLTLVYAWCVFACVEPDCASAVSVTEHHNHDSRDGLYIDSAFTRAAAAGLKRDVAFDGGVRGNVYLLNRANLGGISLPVAQKHVVNTTIIQASASYQTTLGAYLVLAASGNLYALRIGATNPPTITTAWSASEGAGRGSPFVTSTDGTNNVIVWGIGSEGDQRLHGFDGDTGTNVFTGGGASELMAGTRRFNTAIVAHGRIYVANDNKVYAFFVPGQPVTPVILTNLAVLPDGTFQFAVSNASGTNFSVYGTTNLSILFTNWPKLGSAAEIAPGQYRFSDSLQNTNVSRFYRVSSP